jgi:hypothetical protein
LGLTAWYHTRACQFLPKTGYYIADIDTAYFELYAMQGLVFCLNCTSLSVDQGPPADRMALVRKMAPQDLARFLPLQSGTVALSRLQKARALRPRRPWNRPFTRLPARITGSVPVRLASSAHPADRARRTPGHVSDQGENTPIYEQSNRRKQLKRQDIR